MDTLLASEPAGAASTPEPPTVTTPPPSYSLPSYVPYRDLYEAAGKTCPNISARLLAAQGKQESGWNPRAGSQAGAKGIAQFIDGTWASWSNGGDVWNPADAIAAQARFMCKLQERYVTMDKVLAAYNAGPGAVDKYGGVPPFLETQNYVRSIKSIYARLE